MAWKKIDDDFMQRIYKSGNGQKLRVLKKSFTVQVKPNEILPYRDVSRAYTLKSATSFSKKYMKAH